MCKTEVVFNSKGKSWFDLIDIQEKIKYYTDYSEDIDAQLLESDYELKKTLFASTANRRKIKKQLQTKQNENAKKILIFINDYEHNLARQQFEIGKDRYQDLLTEAEELLEAKSLYKSAFKAIRDPSSEKIQWQQIHYDERLRTEVIYIAYSSKTEMASDGTKIKHSFPLPTSIKNTYYFKRSEKPIGERKGVLIYGAYITHPLPEDLPQFNTILRKHTG